MRSLMKRRKINGVELAAEIGVSPTSVSKILNGRSKPRQLTLTRIMKALCRSPDEEQVVVRAFTGLLDSIPDEPETPPRPIPEDEMERVTRYLEVKSMSVAFRNDVEAVLLGTGLSYQPDFRMEPYICDFLVEQEGRRVAVDCKFNINRDWDRTYATVKLLRENLPCDEVIVVVPYENDLARKAQAEIESAGGRVMSLETFKEIFA